MDQRSQRRLSGGITRKSITAYVIRQGRNPFSTKWQICRSGAHWQKANSSSQNRATFTANDVRANRHSDALKSSLNGKAPLKLLKA